MDEQNLPKGMSLEREFSEFMVRRLGYDSVKLRVPVTGRVAQRNYEVDVKGMKYERRWEPLTRVGIFLLLVAIATLLLPKEFRAVSTFFEGLIGGINPSLAAYAMFIVGALAIVLAYAGKRQSEVFAWVECKDRQSNVKRAQVQKLISSSEDVIENEGAKWKPSILIMVSGSDFDEDALNFAEEHDIQCFRRKGKSFEEI